MLFGITKVTLDIPTDIISTNNFYHGKPEMICNKKDILTFFITRYNKTDFSQLIQPDQQRFGLYRTFLRTRRIGGQFQSPSPLPLGIVGSRKLSSLNIDRPIAFCLRNIGISFLLANIYHRWIQIPAIEHYTYTNTSRRPEILNEFCCQLIFVFEWNLILLQYSSFR